MAGKIAEWLRTSAALLEAPGLILGIDTVAHNPLWLQFQGTRHRLLASASTRRGTSGAHTFRLNHTCAIHTFWKVCNSQFVGEGQYSDTYTSHLQSYAPANVANGERARRKWGGCRLKSGRLASRVTGAGFLLPGRWPEPSTGARR